MPARDEPQELDDEQRLPMGLRCRSRYVSCACGSAWGGGANHIHHAQRVSRGAALPGTTGHIVNYARSPGRRAGGSWTPKLVVDTRARPRHCRVRCGARRPQSMAEARRSAAQERQSTAEETLARVESPAMLRSQRAAACRRSRCYLVPRNLCRAACSDRVREWSTRCSILRMARRWQEDAADE